jgi:integrase
VNTVTNDTRRDTKPAKRADRLSPDGKWRSFPKVPNLLQYVSTGTYFARVKVNGKVIRRTLKIGKTDVASFTTAKERLRDFLTKHQGDAILSGSFADAQRAYTRALELDNAIAPATKRYRDYCLKALEKSWPELAKSPLSKITARQCQEWAARFAPTVDEQYFNNTLGTLREILRTGGFGDKNPAMAVSRIGVKPKQLRLPEPDQFTQIIETVATSGAGQQKNCADFIRFLAFSGCRLSEAKEVKWADVDLDRGFIRVKNAKRKITSNKSETRLVPIIDEMRELITRLKQAAPQPTDAVCRVFECEKSLTRACNVLGIDRITHHDLRHLFATRCIESGVDIPTVSRWLGHSDGGALAMRVYGHLRDAHSAEMARRVSFTKPANIVEIKKEVA